MMGHLNNFSGSGGGNFPKLQMPGGGGGGVYFKL